MNDLTQGGEFNHGGRHGVRGLDRIPLGSLVAGDDTTGQMFYVDANKEVARLDLVVPAANVRNVLGVDNGGTLPAWKTALDSTDPTKVVIPASSSPGTSLIFAHRDHTHGADAHNLLSTAHGDTTAGTVTRGDVIIADSTPKWVRLAKPASPAVFYSDATDVAWDTMAWIAVAYDSGDYTASSGNWTVDSGDVVTLAYRLFGKTMVVAFYIISTDVSATPATLGIKIPASKTAARAVGASCFISDAGTGQAGLALVSASGTTIAIQKASGAAFTLTAGDNTNVIGEITFETT